MIEQWAINTFGLDLAVGLFILLMFTGILVVFALVIIFGCKLIDWLG